jgi:hypothetical protein
MQREAPRSVQRNMIVLGAVEAGLALAIICATSGPAGLQSLDPRSAASALTEAPLAAWLAAAAATALVAAILAITATAGRSAQWLTRKRLVTATLASLAASALALVLFTQGAGTSGSTAQAVLVGKLLAAWVGTVGVLRLVFSLGLGRNAPRPIVLIIGDQAPAARLVKRLKAIAGDNFDPVAPLRGDISWPDLSAGRRVWGIVLASEPSPQDVSPLLDCKLRGVRIVTAAAFQETHLGRVDIDALTPAAILAGEGFTTSGLGDTIKRAGDICISIAMIAVTLPLMLLTALAIKADSPGPVLYRQQRVGAHGRIFTVLKFRSMTVDAEAGGKARWAQRQDPRVTRVGRFIRATRIDELPQLVNVISGEMSLVGPRPERPVFVEQLTEAIPFYAQRAYVKPGLTGWAQVNYPYGASVEDAREKLAYDLYYVKHRSLLLDLRILLATVRVVLFRQGAR